MTDTPVSSARHDPEDYLMGRDEADVKQAIDFHDRSDDFSIVPVRFTGKMLLAGVAGMVIGLLLPSFLGSPSRQLSANQIIWYFVAMAGVLAIYGFIGWFVNRRAKKLGPLLIFEKATGAVVLPRQNLLIKRDQIVFVQVITGYEGDKPSGAEYTEINFITQIDGQRMRWPIASRLQNYQKLVRPVLKRMVVETDLPMKLYRQKWRDGSLFVEKRDMREMKERWWSS